MYHSVIICKSQTEAFKISKILRNNLINNSVIKPPREMLINSCTFGVKINEGNLNQALCILKKISFSPKGIYTME